MLGMQCGVEHPSFKRIASDHDPLPGRLLTPNNWEPDLPGVDINRNDPVNGIDANAHLYEDS